MLNLLLQTGRRRPRTLTSTLMHLGAVGLFFLAILDSSPLPTFGGLDILTPVLAASHRNPWYEYAAPSPAGSIVAPSIRFAWLAKPAPLIWIRNSRKAMSPNSLTYLRSGEPERWQPPRRFLCPHRPACSSPPPALPITRCLSF